MHTGCLGAPRAPTSSWTPIWPSDFVRRALQALRPCDPCKGDITRANTLTQANIITQANTITGANAITGYTITPIIVVPEQQQQEQQ